MASCIAFVISSAKAMPPGAAGLEPQQHPLLRMARGLPEDQEATIRTLAERLALKHHGVVE